MKEQNHEHLRDEEVLWAIIDKKELAVDLQQHLLECQVCNAKVEEFREDLQGFGLKAKQAVPPFSRPVKLPAVKPSSAGHYGGWLPFFGAAAMAGLVVFLYFMGMKTLTPVQFTTLQSQEALLEDEALMREISEIVEYPLSKDIYEITGENGTGYDEDFLDFVVPDMQDDFQSDFFI